MRSYPLLLLVAILTLSSFSSKTTVDTDVDIFLSIKKFSKQTSVNVLFFTDGSCSIQKLEDGKQTSSRSVTLSKDELKSLKRLVTKVRPIELNNTYTCKEKKINKTDATLYSFVKSNKTVVVNNSCKTVKRINDVKDFVNSVLKENL